MTPAKAVENACRILQNAELETNLLAMERLDEMSMSWMRVAEFLVEHSEIQSEP